MKLKEIFENQAGMITLEIKLNQETAAHDLMRIITFLEIDGVNAEICYHALGACGVGIKFTRNAYDLMALQKIAKRYPDCALYFFIGDKAEGVLAYRPRNIAGDWDSFEFSEGGG